MNSTISGKQVFPALQTAGEPFYGFEARGAYWADIGTPNEYRRASYDVLRGVITIPGTPANGVDPSAKIGREVRIEGPVRLCADARVGDGVTIVGPSIVGERAAVEPRARLERAILWEGSQIGAGAELRDAVVGANFAVSPGAKIENALVATDE